MHLRMLLPTQILVDCPVSNVDFVAALAPGILSYTTMDGEEEFAAIDEGVLVKHGPDVLVSVRDAVRGGDLGFLRMMVHDRFEALDDREKRARGALALLEADFVRRFIELRD
jgi:F-type H+-transporting ATPase subunit epsilon